MATGRLCPGHAVRWATDGNPGSQLVVEHDAHVVIYRPDRSAAVVHQHRAILDRHGSAL